MGKDADLNAARRDAERLKAIQDLAAGGPRIFDRFGRPIMVGCDIELHTTLPIIFTVVDAKPDLSRNAPVGRWILTLATQLPLFCLSGKEHDVVTVVSMPEVQQQEDPGQPVQSGDPAASDAPAPPPSSIVLTDMDKTARETLEAAPLKQGLSLVPPPAATEPPPYDSLKELETQPSIGDLQSPAAATLRPDAHSSDLGEER